jgi:NADH pyrophosphatase NudC (nudix superfamily)
MIGCVAKATNDELHVDRSEMDEVRWIHRDQVAKAVQSSSSHLLGMQPSSLVCSTSAPHWGNHFCHAQSRKMEFVAH